MTKSKAEKLIEELFGLYARYGRADFDKAIKRLESGDQVTSLLRLASLGNSAFSAGHIQPRNMPSASRTSKSVKQRFDEFVTDLKQRADEDSHLIARFISDIADRKLLRNAAMLRDYSRTLGIRQDIKMDRRLVARKIGNTLLRESPSVRRNHVAIALQIGAEKSTLQAWSDVIVKDRS